MIIEVLKNQKKKLEKKGEKDPNEDVKKRSRQHQQSTVNSYGSVWMAIYVFVPTITLRRALVKAVKTGLNKASDRC